MRGLLLGAVLAGAVAVRAQTPDALMRMLQDPRTASSAEVKLEQLGETSTPVREVVSVQLPGLLVPGDVRSQAHIQQLELYAALAGKLRLRSTIVPLGKLAEFPQIRGTGGIMLTSFYAQFQLTQDPVCRALVLIGDPAVPELTRLLNLDSNVIARERAASALDLLHTPRARAAIRARIPREGETWFKKTLECLVEF